jgi:hypothetical protein
MNNRTAGILTTSVAAIMCGCPGILILCVGAVMAFSSLIPGAQFDLPSGNTPRSAIAFGSGAFCLGMILIVIPIIVGMIALRNRPEMVVAPEEVLNPGVPAGTLSPDEPIPPAS